MKNLGICFIILILSFVFITSASAADTVKVTGNTAQYLNQTNDEKIIVNGKVYKGKYCLQNDRTEIDAWDFTQNYLLGEKDDNRNWFSLSSDSENEIIIKRESDGRQVTFYKGSSKMKQPNKELKNLDCSSFVYQETNFVPLRYLCESFGYSVDWDGKAKTIIIEKEA